MKIKIIAIGKTVSKYLSEGEMDYLKRLQHYIKVEKIEFPDIKNAKNKTQDQIKAEEGQMMLKAFKSSDLIVLLDENGKERTSREFSEWLQNMMNHGLKEITFVIGGPYGFSGEVYNAAHEKLSLSRMTFNHQMIRMLFFEQLYRGFTILRNEPYHHD